MFRHPLGRNELHFNSDYAQRSEHGRMLVNSGLTVAIVLGISVGDIIQSAIANLGWDCIRLAAPVFVGETLYGESIVTALRDSRSRPEAGIVTCFTRGLNQHAVEVLMYQRTALIMKCSAKEAAQRFPTARLPIEQSVAQAISRH